MEALSANIAARLAEAARKHPSRGALIESRRGRRHALTYLELAREIAARARAFRERGVGPGERVLLLVPMSIELYLSLLGVLHAGGVAVFVDAWAGWRRVDEGVRRTKPRLFVGSPRAQMLRILSPAVRAIPARMTVRPGATMAGGAAEFPPEPLGPDAPALVTFTTGSTGSPKASLRTHGFLWDQHVVLSKHLGPAEGAIDMPTLPIFVLHNLAAGATSVLPDFDPRRPAEIDPRKISEQIASEGVTSAVASPAFFDRLLVGRRARLPLQRAFTGGAPVLPALAQRMEEGIEGEAFAVYGSTEAEPISLISARDMRLAMAETGREGLCVGVPVSEIRVKLVHPALGEIRVGSSGWAGIECAPGEAGEIVVSGPQVQTGYFDDATSDRSSKIADGLTVWHRTGDGGRIDEQGRLWLLGRVGARVSTAGQTWWSLPAEIAATKLPGVRHAAYIGDARRGAILCLEGSGLVATEAFLAQIRKRLSPYPVNEVRVLRTIPRDPRHVSKTDMRALRRRLGLSAPTV